MRVGGRSTGMTRLIGLGLCVGLGTLGIFLAREYQQAAEEVAANPDLGRSVPGSAELQAVDAFYAHLGDGRVEQARRLIDSLRPRYDEDPEIPLLFDALAAQRALELGVDDSETLGSVHDRWRALLIVLGSDPRGGDPRLRLMAYRCLGMEFEAVALAREMAPRTAARAARFSNGDYISAVAEVQVVLGDPESAFVTLRDAARAGVSEADWLRVNPLFAELRQDAEAFGEVMEIVARRGTVSSASNGGLVATVRPMRLAPQSPLLEQQWFIDALREAGR